MGTKFASPERKNWNYIISDFNDIKDLDYIQELINALPYVVTILNEDRQIIFTNEKLLKLLGINSIEDILGKRPGEAVQCIHANKEAGGCGTSDYCRYCGAINSIIKSQKLKTKVVEECRITTQRGNELISYDFEVSAAPFNWQNKEYTIFTIQDISNEKRRRALERIFFHDIINKTGGLGGFLEILKYVDDKERIKEITDIMEEITNDLNEEIIAQRQLLEAENNELKINKAETNNFKIIQSVTSQIKYNQVADRKEIIIDPKTTIVEFTTDQLLLKRVLTNMAKNALEASLEENKVIIGSTQIENRIAFWVKNEKTIPNHIQLQIFQRSFSTKGKGRGLGTYSMKLIGEKYLKGKVSFKSNEQEGTIFMINLPLHID